KLSISELLFEVPIDYSNTGFGSLQLFARSVSKYEHSARLPTDQEIKKSSQKPWLVYLQGGPGFGCSPPQNLTLTNTILDKGYQILYLDQRGTGLSSPISAQSLTLRGNVQKQFEYLKCFRADNIVRDCEAIRKIITTDYPEELKKWSILGQSFGGFCVFTYLSLYPEGLCEAFTTGGIPPIGQSPDQVYKSTYAKVIERNKAYYQKFPEDVETVHSLSQHINSKANITLPSGIALTVQLFLTLGRAFGFHGGLDSVHELILRMKTDLAQFKFITRPTLGALENALSFENNVLYALLHEAIYCEKISSNWAAERVGKNFRESALFFAGEMIYPFLFEVSPELRDLFPVAEKIALFESWPQLYDQSQLSQNKVPLYAATFIDD
ncbi:hypothetical protein EPUL_002121, partial [Erysiphe pulchra]